MSTGEKENLAKLTDALTRLGGFPIGKTIVLSAENDGSGPERVIAQTHELRVDISYQFRSPGDEAWDRPWQTWQDSGVSLSWDEVRALLKGLIP